jgi:hypothetical protein
VNWLKGRYRPFCDMVLCRLEFRLRRLSGRGAETSGRPGLTHKRHARFRVFAAQIDHCTPYRWSQFPVLMA